MRSRSLIQRAALACLCCALVLALAAPAAASTFAAMSRAEMLRDAEAVVVGKVVKVESFWNPEGTVILTEALVEVEETVVGRANATVVSLRTFGGQVGGYRIEAHGFPTFAEGERMLVFLTADGGESYRVTGYQLGHYRIERNQLGMEVAVPALELGVSVVTAQGLAAARPAARELETLKSELRGLARDLAGNQD